MDHRCCQVAKVVLASVGQRVVDDLPNPYIIAIHHCQHTLGLLIDLHIGFPQHSVLDLCIRSGLDLQQHVFAQPLTTIGRPPLKTNKGLKPESLVINSRAV